MAKRLNFYILDGDRARLMREVARAGGYGYYFPEWKVNTQPLSYTYVNKLNQLDREEKPRDAKLQSNWY